MLIELKYKNIHALTNERLLKWHVLISKIEEYAPIVYTHTLELACQNYNGFFY